MIARVDANADGMPDLSAQSTAVAILGVVAVSASASAWLALRRLRLAHAALHISEAKELERVETDQKMDADRRLAGDLAHDLNDLLTAITGHTELANAYLSCPD